MVGAKFPEKMNVGITIGDTIDIITESYPNKEAVVMEPYRKTWEQLKSDVDNLAMGLMKFGLNPGDRACIWSRNSYQWIVAMFSIIKAGGIMVPLDYWYKKHEAEYILNHSNANFIFCAESYLPMIETMQLEDAHVIVVDEEPKATFNNGHLTHFWKLTSAEYTQEEKDKLAEVQKNQKQDDISIILYTSGTTGNPKGAMLTHTNVIQDMIETAHVMNMTSDDVMIVPVPFSHCFGCEIGVIIGALTGATIVPLLDQNPKTILSVAMKEKATIIHGTPTHFIRYIREYKSNMDQYDLSTLRSGIIGGAPAGKELMQDIFNVLKIKEMSHAYGLTEASPLVSATRSDDPLEKREDSTGKVYPGLSIKIVDEHHKEVPVGKEGELLVKGWAIMKGYYNAPEMTKKALDKDGYLHTGDLATIDEEGYLRIVGRKKDIIIYGGANIYPKMVEDYILTNPNVLECSIVGVPDKEYGELVACVAEVKPGFTEQELVDFCFGQINDFAVPRYVRFDIPLPLSGRGKVQKFKLRETLIEMSKNNVLGKPIVPTVILERKKAKLAKSA